MNVLCISSILNSKMAYLSYLDTYLLALPLNFIFFSALFGYVYVYTYVYVCVYVRICAYVCSRTLILHPALSIKDTLYIMCTLNISGKD